MNRCDQEFDIETARSLRDSYFATFPGIGEWQEQTVSTARVNGYTATPLGRRRIARVEDGDASIINFPIQGTASDGFKTALVLLDEELAGMDAEIVHTQHDEMILEVRIEETERVAAIVRECMEKALSGMVADVPFEVDIEWADSWGKR